MSKFKQGNIVEIIKPAAVVDDSSHQDSSSPARNTWNPDMDRLVGLAVTLNSFSNRNGWKTLEVPYVWLEDWFKPISIEGTDPVTTTDAVEDPNAAYDRAMGII